jgi:L-aminopeptidase/D-esterase-like protein
VKIERIMGKHFKVGHFTDKKNITGCTVILCPQATTASCFISGSAPGSRETALLSPEKKVNEIHALLFTGGSAYGLGAAQGVMNYLEERDKGYKTGFGVVPLVPAAVIYDLNIGNPKARPLPDDAYQACINAVEDFTEQGSVGAGTGATVGKWSGVSGGMKGGLGIASSELRGAWVTALAVVNAVGDIINEKNDVIAGALDNKGRFLARGSNGIRWKETNVGFSENTVICSLLTNVVMTKLECHIFARRAQCGLARAVIPASTSYDGDAIFVLSSGTIKSELELIYEMGTEILRRAIVSAVQHAESLGGYLALKDLS